MAGEPATAADGMHSTGMHSCYHLQTKLREGYVFTAVCDSVHGGGLSQCMLGYHPPPRSRHPPEQTPPWSRHTPPPGSSPCAVHAGRYGQQAGGMHPTGMQSCFLTDIRAYGEEIYCFSCSILLHLHITHL